MNAHGFSTVGIGTRLCFIDKSGNKAIDRVRTPRATDEPKSYEINEAEDFRGGLARVHIGGAYDDGHEGGWKGGAWCYVDRQGTLVRVYERDPR
jgi:hypothetical protein